MLPSEPWPRSHRSESGCAASSYLPCLSSGCRCAWHLFLAQYELGFLSPESERLPTVTAGVGWCWSDEIPEAKEAKASGTWHSDNTVTFKKMYFSLRSQSVEWFSSVAASWVLTQELGGFLVSMCTWNMISHGHCGKDRDRDGDGDRQAVRAGTSFSGESYYPSPATWPQTNCHTASGWAVTAAATLLSLWCRFRVL